jgi:hypothetical protein
MSHHTTRGARRPHPGATEAATPGPAVLSSQTPLLSLYVAAMLASAALLFVVQPMFARMVLPLLGGSPAVWNTALVFYQVVLLAGYSYAYAVSRWLSLPAQLILHSVVILLPFVVLPIRVPLGAAPDASGDPAVWLLGVLAIAVGLPFFAVSTTSPLLQRWFVATGHRHARDPYFLYAASNLGSLVALLGYPLIVERFLSLADQSVSWRWGYVVLVLLLLACAAAVWTTSRAVPAAEHGERDTADAAAVTSSDRLRWLGLAAVPVSLMLSVTTYISTDVAAIPLLWVIPLAIYLTTFILTFARRPLVPPALFRRVMPVSLVALFFVLAAKQDITNWFLIGLHLLVFFVVAMVCLGELAARRPHSRHLAEFYFWLSFGGAVGGLFNAILAPVLFEDVYEYPITLLLAVLLVPATSGAVARAPRVGRRRAARAGSVAPSGFGNRLTLPTVLDLLLPVAVLLVTAALVNGIQEANRAATWPERIVMFGPPAVMCLMFLGRPLRFSLALGAMLVASSLYVAGKGTFILTERTFYGVNRVMLFPSGTYHVLGHGNTMHGAQSLDPSRRREPLTYFYPNGPLGQMFTSFTGERSRRRVGVVGLGAGSIACYRRPGQEWTFYEIDPAVAKIASDPKYFTYLQECAPDARIVLGDGRRSLAAAPQGAYDLLILDAFSSDAVPIHLVTREAVALYLDKLAPGGLLVFNITNRHLDLQTVIGNLAEDAGLTTRVQHDLSIDPRDGGRGKMASQWAIVARSDNDFGPLASDPRWTRPRIRAGTAAWTDNFSSLLSVYVWD